MPEWEAPDKLNLDLRVRSAEANGMHPIRSVTQTIQWCDLLEVEVGDEDLLEVDGADLSDGGDNLVWKAVEVLGLSQRPPLEMSLTKRVAVAAGLGGGSADAAAALAAVAAILGVDHSDVIEAAPKVGADVAYFLTGGTALMEGYGSDLTAMPPLGGFAVAVAVPPFELSTPEVYRRWDELGEPVADPVEARRLPPSLRHILSGGNDLTPAALSLRPELGDWLIELERLWERPVMMSGSGPSCFGYFLDVDEAASAAESVSGARESVAAELRSLGVAPVAERET